MALYEEAVRLVGEVPEVKAVRETVEVPDVGTAPIVHSDSVCVQVEIQQKLRSRGLLRGSEADRWGATCELRAGTMSFGHRSKACTPPAATDVATVVGWSRPLLP
jgi:hypothetical protein